MKNKTQSLPAAAHDTTRLAEEVYGEMGTPFDDCASSADADHDRALIAGAIAAERERCAKITESPLRSGPLCAIEDPQWYRCQSDWARTASERIRSGK